MEKINLYVHIILLSLYFSLPFVGLSCIKNSETEFHVAHRSWILVLLKTDIIHICHNFSGHFRDSNQNFWDFHPLSGTTTVTSVSVCFVHKCHKNACNFPGRTLFTHLLQTSFNYLMEVIMSNTRLWGECTCGREKKLFICRSWLWSSDEQNCSKEWYQRSVIASASSNTLSFTVSQ